MRGRRTGGHMRRADVEAGGDLDPAVLAKPAEEFEAAFQARTDALQTRGETGRHSGLPLAGLDNSDPRVDPGLVSQADSLLETDLRIPPPKITRPGQGREPHLRQRIRIPWREDGLVLGDCQASALPVDP